jgi:hypothetical protein
MRRARAGVNRKHVGWVERSDTHQRHTPVLMGFASHYPSYRLRQLRRHLSHPLGGQVVRRKEGFQRQLLQRDVDSAAARGAGNRLTA